MFFERGSLSVAALFLFFENMESREVTALFIGNRDCYNVSKTDIESAVIEAIGSGIRVFLNGGQGYFDKTCASVLYHLKPNYPTIKSYLIIPYQTFKSYNKDMYDEIIYPFEQHIESYYTYMGNIEKRNRWLVDHSCMAICYLNHTTGGAGKTFAYAKKKELTIIDLKAGEAGG